MKRAEGMEERLFIPCEDHDIPLVLTLPDTGKASCPALLLLHGFMAYKEGDGYLLRVAAQRLAEAGVASARIDFCSMGENRASRRRYGLEMLRKEARTAYKYLCERPEVDDERVGLLGHSMGGRVALLCAEVGPKCIVTLNGAAGNTEQRTKKHLFDAEQMEKKGYCLVETSDGRTELLFPQFAEDAHKYSQVDISGYRGSLLVCVGEADPTVPPQIGYDFFRECGVENKALVRIADANHTFNAKTGDYTKAHELMDRVNSWLEENL